MRFRNVFRLHSQFGVVWQLHGETHPVEVAADVDHRFTTD
jgi:hypothetical protein